MSYDPKVPRCLQCGRGADDAKFGVRSDTGKTDDLCVRCRFDTIDGKHSNSRGIRRDMRDSGVPTNGRSATLRFEPGADRAALDWYAEGVDEGEDHGDLR